jgi:hypothetical protein
MLKPGDKLAYKLSKRIGQVLDLPTVSTSRHDKSFLYGFLCGLGNTASTQFSSRYAQAVSADFNLSGLTLYPVSTAPTTNTNLYKGIVL